jgi:hypothetical protein
LDTVSTGSGSDLVSDRHAIFLRILSPRRTRSLPLPVLTVSKCGPIIGPRRSMNNALLLRRIVGRAAGNHVIRMSFHRNGNAPSFPIVLLVGWIVANDITLI